MAVVVPIVVPAIVRHQRRILEALRAAGATHPSRAASIEQLGVHDGQAMRILLRHEVVRDAGDRRLWLDEAACTAHEARHTRFAIGAAVIMGTLVFGGLLALWLAKN